MTDLTPGPAPTIPRPHQRTRRNLVPMIVLAAVLVAGGVIVTQFLRSAVDYYCNVDEVGNARAATPTDASGCRGVVGRGTVVASGGDTSFTIGFNGAEIPVLYDGEPGGIFKECIPVVVHGSFDTTSETFLGDRVEVKHSDEYVAVNDERLEEADDLADACDTGSA